MSCVRCLLLVLFVCASLRAETVVIIQGGKAWYVPAGSSVAIPADRVIRLAGNGPIDPTDPPVDPPNEGELEQLSSAWKVKVAPYSKRNHHRLGLMATYSVLGQQAADGEFSDLADLQERTRQTYDLLLGDDKERWSEWYAPIGEYLGVNVLSLDDVPPAYAGISAGLEVPGEAIGPVWAIVIKLIIGMLGDGDIDPKMLALIMLLLDALAGGST